MTQEYIGTKQVTAWEQEKDDKPGYAVKYADGYVSWSPKDVFEAAYLPMGHVGHMPAHQQRVVGEHVQLAEKLDKLNGFFGTDVFRCLNDEEQARLRRQAAAMRDYVSALKDRIAAF